ncbi:MAG: dienelactone hydrolase family protein, partial [Myxococcota bacterium]|nr:dienelactone hydrolase family protein [Myxococcota bacterium]
MATHLDARAGTAVVIGALGVASALGLAMCDLPGEGDANEVSAEAIVTHTPEVWPPVGGDLDAELQATAIRRIGASAYDAGWDAGPGDAGPPIALPDQAELGDIEVRRGFLDGLHYLEVVYGGASFDDALPIAFVLHGRGGNAQLPGGPFLELSHPVRVIVPQAPERLGDGWMWIPVSVGSGLVDRLASTLFQVTSRVARFIRQVAAERPTIGRPIVTGFSQGGLLTYALALHHDDVVGHAFPLSTWLPPPLEPLYRRDDLRYPPIRAMHGSSDPIIPIGPTRELVDRLRERGFDVEFEEFPGVGHEMSDDMNALFHRWLERAVCDSVGDFACPGALAPGEDGGLPLLDAGDDAG